MDNSSKCRRMHRCPRSAAARAKVGEELVGGCGVVVLRDRGFDRPATDDGDDEGGFQFYDRVCLSESRRSGGSKKSKRSSSHVITLPAAPPSLPCRIQVTHCHATDLHSLRAAPEMTVSFPSGHPANGGMDAPGPRPPAPRPRPSLSLSLTALDDDRREEFLLLA